MKTQITEDFAAKFKRGYNYRMGGTQTLIFPNGQKFYFNDREYYGGRGAKYNSSIRHHDLGDVIISKSELAKVVKEEKDRAKRIASYQRELRAKAKRIAVAKKKGVYDIIRYEYGDFIELSDNESEGKYFDAERLAKTLKISLKDANLLNSKGKTYVFAKSDDNKTYMLYHPSLFCNRLSIMIEIATPETIEKFKPSEWQSAPFAHEVGQTLESNHFVC